MTFSLNTLFLLLAVVFFLLAAFRVSASVDWTNLGFASVAAAFLV